MAFLGEKLLSSWSWVFELDGGDVFDDASFYGSSAGAFETLVLADVAEKFWAIPSDALEKVVARSAKLSRNDFIIPTPPTISNLSTPTQGLNGVLSSSRLRCRHQLIGLCHFIRSGLHACVWLLSQCS